MTRPRFNFARLRGPRLLAALAAAGLLGGCVETTNWTPHETPTATKVEFVSFTHEVAFAEGSAALGEDEARRFERFLWEVAPVWGDEVTLIVAPPVDAALSERRAAAVAAFLRDRRVVVAPPRSDPAAAPGAVAVRLGRHVATPPKCPNWTKSPGNDSGNQHFGNFGCATEANLGLMVADPGDLVRGREMGPADADVTSRYQRVLREGKREPLPSVRTNATFGSQGGQ